MTFYGKNKHTYVISFILTVIISQVANAQQNLLHTNPKPSISVSSISALLAKNDFSLFDSHISIIPQLGVFDVVQGSTQNVGIDSLLGDRFTIAYHHAQNYLLGIALFFDGTEQEKCRLMYGINAFYFAHTQIEGNVIQEQVFTNLAYHYSITQIPIYFAVKTLININSKYDVTLDFGIGPNVIKTYDFSERSLDGGVTIPDQIFSGKSNVVFSATAGIGIRIDNGINHMPIECGYRFFYLGKGKLSKLSNQVQNTLSTGTTFANALVFSISV